MLDAGRYLLGVAEILLLAGFAWLGAGAVRSRLVPDFSGAPALLSSTEIAHAVLLLSAELLGSFDAFDPLPYLLLVAAVGAALWTLLRWVAPVGGGRGRTLFGPPAGPPRPGSGPAGRGVPGAAGRGALVATWIALAIAGIALLHFADGARSSLDTGMTGFDSTWYHGPFAAGFFQSGDTWSLHFIAPQFLAWFYPGNSEVFHAVGMLAFDRDLLSPLLNVAWFAACLLACWCIGRPQGVAPWSLALGALALSVPAFADQAGEARNDIVGTFFLLAGAGVALQARGSLGAVALTGLAAGLAAGTKLNFLPPAAVLALGAAALLPPARRGRGLTTAAAVAVVGGGYWYLRNLAHTGNPLPWVGDLGPIGLPAPEQALGGRDAHTVLGYLGDGSVWADWLLPGLHEGLWVLWPLLVGAALLGLALNLGRRASPGARLVALTGLAAALAWLVAPTSASGPAGMPRGFESGLRYLVPALVLGLAMLPSAPALRRRPPFSPRPGEPARAGHLPPVGHRFRRLAQGLAIATVLVAVGLGYAVQRDYLRDRYASPSFAAPGLNAAFEWATPLSGARIATTSTRQYPLFGTTLDNRVEFVGEERPHGGFVAPATCRAWRQALDAGGYEYVVASRDRVEAGKPAYPAEARWTEGPGATPLLAIPPTKVFRLDRPLDPSACPSATER